MNRLRVVLTLVAVIAFASCSVQAQATRTWVSGVGDDANPCSRTAPCKTFAGAISKTAPGGEIDVLDPGGFGALTITKSITLDGGAGQVASVLVAGTNGIVVSAGATDVVTIRNISFQGLAHGTNGAAFGGLNGIQFLAGKSLHIEHCAIQNFTQNGINIAGSGAAQIFIDDTVSTGNDGNGLNIVGTGLPAGTGLDVSVSNSHFSNNAGDGVFSGDFSHTVVRNSDAFGNGLTGFAAKGNLAAATLSLKDSTAGNNTENGVEAGGGAKASLVRVSNVALFGNAVGFAAGVNGEILSFGNNSNAGTGSPTTTIALQ
jgi:hypothetical protein